MRTYVGIRQFTREVNMQYGRRNGHRTGRCTGLVDIHCSALYVKIVIFHGDIRSKDCSRIRTYFVPASTWKTKYIEEMQTLSLSLTPLPLKIRTYVAPVNDLVYRVRNIKREAHKSCDSLRCSLVRTTARAGLSSQRTKDHTRGGERKESYAALGASLSSRSMW